MKRKLFANTMAFIGWQHVNVVFYCPKWPKKNNYKLSLRIFRFFLFIHFLLFINSDSLVPVFGDIKEILVEGTKCTNHLLA